MKMRRYDNRKQLLFVEEGESLCSREKPAEGRAGKRLAGAAVAAAAAELKYDSSVERTHCLQLLHDVDTINTLLLLILL